MITYEKLWEVLEAKKKNRYWLRQNGIHANTIQKMAHNSFVSLESIDRICNLLDCDISDILTFTPESKED